MMVQNASGGQKLDEALLCGGVAGKFIRDGLVDIFKEAGHDDEEVGFVCV
jgi:hypothetical protein